MTPPATAFASSVGTPAVAPLWSSILTPIILYPVACENARECVSLSLEQNHLVTPSALRVRTIVISLV